MDPHLRETSTMWLSMTDDGIVCVKSKSGTYQTLESAKESIAAIRAVAGDRAPVRLLIDLGRAKGQSAEARDYYVNDPASLLAVSQVAMIVGTPVSRIIAAVFMGLSKARVPVRAFSSEPEALAWLREVKPQ